MPYPPKGAVFCFMEEKEFKIRLDWDRMSKKELDSYLYDLHSYLMDFSTSSVVEMVLALDDVARIITDDLNKIANGEDTGLRVLTDEKDSKSYERVMSLVDKIDKWRAVATYAKDLRPKVQNQEEGTQALQEALDSGGFEAIQRRIREARGK